MLYKTLPLLVLAVASQIGEASENDKLKPLFGKEGGSHGPVKREPLFGMPVFGKPPEPIAPDDTASPTVDTVAPTVALTEAPTEDDGNPDVGELCDCVALSALGLGLELCGNDCETPAGEEGCCLA